ncbi:hypothetical protein CIHG_09222 [Coccidioides immitis H538.4]|uniref:Uncharacterized protein n=1 Tax=Coccidioides immitis H538.4 TaxID=396776 RepID=A0A0J8S1T9_COCIT|nr:hypothetical protein CIHG_09222 [Coccidioides immitis H538.4]
MHVFESGLSWNDIFDTRELQELPHIYIAITALKNYLHEDHSRSKEKPTLCTTIFEESLRGIFFGPRPYIFRNRPSIGKVLSILARITDPGSSAWFGAPAACPGPRGIT